MSNTAVGPVYETIINEVINSVRVDFEENGVDDGVLEDLKKKWQIKLSQMNVAQFPWDPRPEPAPTQAAPAQAAAAQAAQATPAPVANHTTSTFSPQASAQPLQGLHANGMGIKNEPHPARADPVIKQEPGLGNPGPQMPQQYANPPRVITAAERAAQAIHSKFGDRAAASIDAIQMTHQQQQQQQQQQQPQLQAQQFQQHPQHQQHQQHQQQRAVQHQQQVPQQQYQQHPHVQQQMQRPGQLPPQLVAQQYRQGLANNIQQRMQQLPHGQPPNGLPAAQVDGAADDVYEGVLMQRGPDGQPVEMGRVEIDELIHSQMAARAKQMEGGGLMLPLKEATKHRGVSSRKNKANGTGAAQFDGLDDDDDDLKDEDLDEDAINSDLDDPNDDKDDDDDDDDAMGHMMLCTYDKVQRVKNKWKCTLKDGVLTVNGREYVFHKATGEYEW
ncbi:transcription initiation factor IIA large subunit [Podospora fimiseda]|uniref:Transcription initiation factor IIA large subunit n=1 Tax=Podospora fimiseda TaxID=252190 RepID=A0AAN7H471_9PEZI|nr:transcription initiation factor IIA large subunit [Podospora fimiseda]